MQSVLTGMFDWITALGSAAGIFYYHLMIALKRSKRPVYPVFWWVIVARQA